MASLTTKTLNPPITVTISEVGVHENGQEGVGIFGSQYGNIDAEVFVTDNNTTLKQDCHQKVTTNYSKTMRHPPMSMYSLRPRSVIT